MRSPMPRDNQGERRATIRMRMAHHSRLLMHLFAHDREKQDRTAQAGDYGTHAG
jgi:hypothetical protein